MSDESSGSPGVAANGSTIYSADDWWALIGPAPRLLTSAIDQTSHDKTRRLARKESLGDVFLRPGGCLLVEYVRLEPVQLEGHLEHESWPIIVEGTTPSAIHLEHDVLTANRVVRAAILCSLAWGEPWCVRSAPSRSLQLPPRVPESWPAPPTSFPDKPMALQLIEAHPDVYGPIPLPAWLGSAWSLLEDDPALLRSTLTWHEALLLQAKHPSFSAVAFVSAVDALSRSLWASEQFGLPGEHHSRKRVRTLLASRMGKEKADLIERIYNDRDNTSHEGRLFAYESSQGALSALTLTPAILNGESAALLVPNAGDRVHEFLQDVLAPLARATRELLLQAFGQPV